jgi:site-specific DNA-cytosine methylase
MSKHLKILLGGSPCTHWSIAQKNNRETEPSGMGWELFKNYLIAKEKFNPDFFLYENNKSAAQAIKDQIAKELGVGVDPKVRFTYINSALVSAQNRQRFYVTNFGDIEQPKDRGILLKDIIESGSVDRDKSLVLASRYAGFVGSQSYLCRRYFGKSFGQAVFEGDISEIKHRWENNPYFESEERNIRPMTVTECCRLQTLPDNYCKILTESHAKAALGNGWTAEVIIHLLNHALKDVPRNEELVVLSLYDGIGTGRYCLDKMGFTNVKYYAYEIDKYAMAIANDNYPDIIQCGDAFQMRNTNWSF